MQVELPWKSELLDGRTSGCVVAADGRLRVVHAGYLVSIDLLGRMSWSVSLPCERYHSLPTALDDGSVLVTTDNGTVIVGSDGSNLGNLEPDVVHDDSGASPCLTHDGVLVLTGSDGEVVRFGQGGWVSLGAFGYDIVPPSVFPDNTLGISGYYGTGICRVSLDGRILWKGCLREADAQSCVARDGRLAASSLNEGKSCFYDHAGKRIGEYGRPAVFAAHDDCKWTAVSDDGVALLDAAGHPLWFVEADTERSFGALHPIVDSEGFSYVPTRTGLSCFDANGQLVFNTVWAKVDRPSPVAIVSPGVIGTVHQTSLRLIGDCSGCAM